LVVTKVKFNRPKEIIKVNNKVSLKNVDCCVETFHLFLLRLLVDFTAYLQVAASALVFPHFQLVETRVLTGCSRDSQENHGKNQWQTIH